MKALLILPTIAVLAILSSCSKDCPTKLVELRMKSIAEISNDTPSLIDGYYLSDQFENSSINFQFSYTQQGAGDFCNYYWTSYPIDNGIKIISLDTVTFENNTFDINTDVSHEFDIDKIERNFIIKYLIKGRSRVTRAGEYRFKGVTELDDGTTLTDTVSIRVL